MSELRLVTWNVRAFRDDRAAVVRTLRGLRPDLLCLQEAPRGLRWRARLAALARESELLYAAGGRTSGSTALLAAVRVDVRETRELLLSPTPGLEQRGATLGRVRLPGTADVAVAAVHLGLDAAERRRHLGEIERALDSLDAELSVVAGDLNEQPHAPVWTALASTRHDCGAADARSTFPAHAGWRIDGVFADRGLELLAYDVVDDPDTRAASDHLPVLAVLRLPGAVARAS